ncbi:MAG TPA: glycosyltransferase, partial [Bacteroidetes bacterium]|nr:glycosyltransferase [Bacteroidota bacterium]
MSLLFLYIFSFLILIIYSFFILYLHHHWEDLEISEPVIKAQNLPFISIIIVGRNESVNIKPCIDSILTNEYPKTKYEIIYIDDGSDDDSIDILNSIKS